MFASDINNPCRPCCYFGTIGNSVSRWCSHGCAQDHFDHFACTGPIYAYLTQLDELTVEENAAIPFSGPGALSYGLRLSDGQLDLSIPGTYKVDYALHIPAGAVVNTTIAVQVGGQTLEGTQQTIIATGAEQPRTVTGQAIFTITEPTTLALVSSDAFSITSPGAGDAVATMSVVCLG